MSNTKEKITLIVFLKYPEPGKVKTRLAKDVGEEQAAEIYSKMATTILEQVTGSTGYGIIIYYDPPEKLDEIKNWLRKYDLLYSAQSGKTLGNRITNAFKEVFDKGADKTVIIGSDCVDVDSDTIKEAITVLKYNDVVLGPAEDGGYYLLGLKKHRPEIFKDIDWSTERVLKQTIEKILENNLSYRLLKILKDLDNVNDLNGKN